MKSEKIAINEEKIRIILEEYRILQTEILHRTNNLIQLIGFCIAFIGVFFALNRSEIGAPF